MNLKDEYEAVCFAYEEKKKELLDFRPDIFTLQPKINQAMEELKELEHKKSELESLMEGI